MTLYVLRHVHTFDDGSQDVKLIGVYSSRKRAKQAVSRVKEEPGFRDAVEGFRIRRFTLDPEQTLVG